MKSLFSILLFATLIGCESPAPVPAPTPTPIAKPAPAPEPPVPAPEPKIVVLDFMASWCAPCIRNAPAIDRLEREGVTVERHDIDSHRELADTWKITAVPSYIVTVDGKETYRTHSPRELAVHLKHQPIRPRLVTPRPRKVPDGSKK